MQMFVSGARCLEQGWSEGRMPRGRSPYRVPYTMPGLYVNIRKKKMNKLGKGSCGRERLFEFRAIQFPLIHTESLDYIILLIKRWSCRVRNRSRFGSCVNGSVRVDDFAFVPEKMESLDFDVRERGARRRDAFHDITGSRRRCKLTCDWRSSSVATKLIFSVYGGGMLPGFSLLWLLPTKQ